MNKNSKGLIMKRRFLKEQMKFLNVLICVTSLTLPPSLLAQRVVAPGEPTAAGGKAEAASDEVNRGEIAKRALTNDGMEVQQSYSGGIGNVGNMLVSNANKLINGYMQNMNTLNRQGILQEQLRVQVQPAEIFPMCAVPMAKDNFPVKVCSSIESQQEYDEAATIIQISLQHIEMLDRMTPTGSAAVGLRCIEGQQKQFDDNMNAMLNALTNAKTQVEKDAQAFRDINKALLDQTRDINNELDGGPARTLQDKGRNWGALFGDAACSNVLSAAQTGQKGLRQIMSAFTGPAGESGKSLENLAADTVQNAATYEAQLNEQIKSINSDIDSVGMMGFLGGSSKKWAVSGMESFQGINEILERKKSEVQTTVAIAQEHFAKVGYQLPPMDSNFITNVQKDLAKSDEYFSKKYVNDCTTMQSETGLGLSTSELLGALKMPEGGKVLDYFRGELKGILDSSGTIEDKMKSIADLEQKYGAGHITLKLNKPFAGNGSAHSYTPYELYQNVITQCKKSFTEKGSDIHSKSYAEEISSAKEAMKKVAALSAEFKSSVGNAIKEEILNCSKRGNVKGQCSANAFDMNSGKYCNRIAISCASSIKSCQDKVQAQIATREKKIADNGALFNANAEALITKQEKMLQNLKANMVARMNVISNLVPGAKFQLAEELFVKMPEMKDSSLGVQLRGGGNLAEIAESFPQNIDKVKEMLAGQVKNFHDQVESYKQKVEASISTNRGRWAALGGADGGDGKCDDAMMAYREGQKKLAGEQQAKYAEQQAKTAAFCRNYEKMRVYTKRKGKSPICSEVQGLYSEINKVQDGRMSTTEDALYEMDYECRERAELAEAESQKAAKEEATDAYQGITANVDDLNALCEAKKENDSVTSNDIISKLASNKSGQLTKKECDKFNEKVKAEGLIQTKFNCADDIKNNVAESKLTTQTPYTALFESLAALKTESIQDTDGGYICAKDKKFRLKSTVDAELEFAKADAKLTTARDAAEKAAATTARDAAEKAKTTAQKTEADKNKSLIALALANKKAAKGLELLAAATKSKDGKPMLAATGENSGSAPLTGDKLPFCQSNLQSDRFSWSQAADEAAKMLDQTMLGGAGSKLK